MLRINSFSSFGYVFRLFLTMCLLFFKVLSATCPQGSIFLFCFEPSTSHSSPILSIAFEPMPPPSSPSTTICQKWSKMGRRRGARWRVVRARWRARSGLTGWIPQEQDGWCRLSRGRQRQLGGLGRHEGREGSSNQEIRGDGEIEGEDNAEVANLFNFLSWKSNDHESSRRGHELYHVCDTYFPKDPMEKISRLQILDNTSLEPCAMHGM